MRKRILLTAVTAIMLCAFASCSDDDNPIAVSGVTLDKETLELTVGKTGQLVATVTPDNAADRTVTWKSSAEAVATVTSDGLVTALTAGQTTITATASGKTATCTVTVTPTVYMSGIYQTDPTDIFTHQGAYWTNGVRTVLALPADATGNNYANGIAVSDGKVYVSGNYNDGTNMHLGYWTDNTYNGLEVAVEAADNLINGIAAAGGTVYTVGYCKAADGNKYGYCWKGNAGEKLPLPDGATSSYAAAVTVSGGKAYISGTYDAGSGQKNCYWADGTFIPLNQPADANNASAGDITVSGGKVYCLGTYTSDGNDYYCYWADGTQTPLAKPADAEMGFDAFSIAADGGNVYVAGKVWVSAFPYVQYACLWTDNVPAALPVPEGVTFSIALYVTVHDGKVCVAGAYAKDGKRYTCYWIDGTRGGDTVTELPDGAGEINYPSAKMTLVW